MANGCRTQIVSAAKRVDWVLAGASGDDRTLHQILRFATASAGAIALMAVLLWFV